MKRIFLSIFALFFLKGTISAQPNPIYGKPQSCDNWLGVPFYTSYVQAGDLDVPGTKITVEAMINRTTPYSGGNLWAGDIVSKHDNPTDVNYLLRPNSAEITTSNGYFITNTICPIDLNKTYHVALVYDGSSLKFYRNGYLMSQVPATGTLYQNDWPLRMGFYFSEIHNSQFIGYINEVRIWNVARTQSEIRSFMNTSLPNPMTQTGLMAYYSFDNLINKQGNPAWNGTLGGSAAINQTNPSCSVFTADSCGIAPPPTLSFDFSYKQNVCNPLAIQYQPMGNNLQDLFWSFGDNNTSSNTEPFHTYGLPGNYAVKLGASDGIGSDTVTKNIAVEVLHDNVITTPDTTICFGIGKQIRTQPSLGFCWSPTTYLDDPNSPNPTATPPQDVTYYFLAATTSNNLVVNGNFSAGNSGFTSQYTYLSPNSGEGQYFVATDPQPWYGNLSSCRDHTTGNGNMMLVNGDNVAGTTVWKQTVPVTSHTNYAFSTWIQSLGLTNPAQLQFSINGHDIRDTITAALPACTWKQFYATWNSGNTTSAVLAIVNKYTSGSPGNDFALDDISFAPVFIKRDSVVITVEKPNVRTINDVFICPGDSTQLSATGAASYAWSPATGLSNAATGNPKASPVATTEYIVTGRSLSGCTAKDSVVVTVRPRPVITKSGDTSICRNASVQLFASGGESYAWSPAATLSDPAIANPIASPVADIMYTVTVTDANNCTNTDSVEVLIRRKPAFSVSPAAPVCLGKTIMLNASGGNEYLWSPANLLNDPTSPTPVATPLVSTVFTVVATESICRYDSTLTVNVQVNPTPDISVQKSNDIDCTTPSAMLLASGADTYSWSPVTGLDNPTKSNPVSNAAVTTTYTVTGTNQFGCSGSDTITVKATTSGRPIFEVPNAFTPNGDRVNDCFGIRKWAQVNQLEFAIYNRWGQKVFSTSDPGACWDGTLNGKPQDSGGFIYIIKATSACGQVFRKGIVMLIR